MTNLVRELEEFYTFSHTIPSTIFHTSPPPLGEPPYSSSSGAATLCAPFSNPIFTLRPCTLFYSPTRMLPLCALLHYTHCFPLLWAHYHCVVSHFIFFSAQNIYSHQPLFLSTHFYPSHHLLLLTTHYDPCLPILPTHKTFTPMHQNWSRSFLAWNESGYITQKYS